MKKVDEIKFQSSANLFQFCRRVLDHKFGGVRVIDQDVGTILGFDPADCSHWKKGKKNIRSIQAMRAIANSLGVDERLVVDIAAGELDDKEAFFEYHGYGDLVVDNKLYEAARKDFYKRNAATWSTEKESEFRALFQIDLLAIDRIVQDIHEKIDFKEAPLYIPEIFNSFPELKNLVCSGSMDEIGKEINGTIVVPPGAESRPFVRFKIAKAIGARLMHERRIKRRSEIEDFAAHVNEIEANLFAAKLLAPAAMVRKELGNVNVSRDVVSQLAETFWVSKTFMNRRLKEILQFGPGI